MRAGNKHRWGASWVALLTALLAALLVPVPGVGAIAGYGDVAYGRYFSNAVQWSVDRGIAGVDGDCFRTGQRMTRGETAVWMWRMAGRPEVSESQTPSPFVDVSDSEQRKAVAWMVANSVTTGTSPTTFSPDWFVTRAEVAAFLWRLEGQPAAAPHGFGDVSRGWQHGPVSWMAAEGITTGTSATTFSPEQIPNRGQVVSFLYRYKGSPAVTIDPDSPACAAAKDPSANMFAAVLSHRGAPESMCLSVVADDRPLLESQSWTPLVPASLIKIPTAVAALEVMSPDETFETSAAVSPGAWSSVDEGVLKGDLYLIGGGDPVLSTPHYAQRWPMPEPYTDVTKLADQVFAALRDHGVTRIEGRVLGDDSWFADSERDYTSHHLEGMAEPVWKPSFVTNNQSGPLSALLLNAGFSSYSSLWTGAGRARSVRATDPAVHAAAMFDDLLEAQGMVITQKPGKGVSPPPGARVALGTLESAPLSEILWRMLGRSDNSIAEILLKQIGRRTGGTDRASATASVEAIMRQKLGVLADGTVIADGSGLSFNNRLTCAALAELLRQAGPDSLIVSRLAQPWESGSLSGCGPSSPTTNLIRAKTGQLNDSKALAGTVVTQNGAVVTFAMIANREFIIGDGYCSGLMRALLNAAARYEHNPA